MARQRGIWRCADGLPPAPPMRVTDACDGLCLQAVQKSDRSKKVDISRGKVK